jgi:hypothetical protein
VRWLVVVAIVACRHGEPPPTQPASRCDDVADHIRTMLPDGDRAAKTRDVFAKRCGSDAWPAEAQSCLLGLQTLHDGHHCKGKLSAEQRGALDHDLDALEASGPPPGLPASCEDYRRAIDRLARCDKLPQATRDQIKQAFDTASAVWKDIEAMPPDAKQALADGCKMAGDAVNKAADVCR